MIPLMLISPPPMMQILFLRYRRWLLRKHNAAERRFRSSRGNDVGTGLSDEPGRVVTCEQNGHLVALQGSMSLNIERAVLKNVNSVCLQLYDALFDVQAAAVNARSKVRFGLIPGC